MITVIAFELDGEETSIVREPDGLLLRGVGGTQRMVADQPLRQLLTDYRDALLPGPPVTLQIRSDVHTGVELAALLEEVFGSDVAEGELVINGLYYGRVEINGEDAAVWVPDDPDRDSGAQVVRESHWDLLSGTPSMGTGSPGTATVIRIGEVSVLWDPSAEVLEAQRGPVIPVAGDAADHLISFQTTRVESDWLAADPERIPGFLSMNAHFGPRAVYINGRLWHRLEDVWRHTPAHEHDDSVTELLSRGTIPEQVEIAPLEGHVSQATTLKPAEHTAVLDPEPERFVLVPGADPEPSLVMAVTQAALKSTHEVKRALVCRVQVGQEARHGVRVAGDAVEVCRGLGLAGWLEVSLSDGAAQGAWVTPSGRRSATWRARRGEPRGFSHPIVTDEWDLH